MKIKLLLPFFFLTLMTKPSFSCIAQTPNDTSTYTPMPYTFQERHLSLLTGLNAWGSIWGELGLAINQYGRLGHHPTSKAFFLSTETKMARKPIFGPKIGIWAGGGSAGMAMGINAVFFTNLLEYNLAIRPEIGLGFDRFKLVYGYNISIIDKDLKGINKNNISLAYLVGFRALKTISRCHNK